MPALHLRHQGFGDGIQIECATFLRYHGVEENLQQQVPQLFPEQSVVARAQSFVHLVRLLDQVRPKRLVGLSRVPVAAASKVSHYRERIFKRSLVLHGLLREPYTTRDVKRPSIERARAERAPTTDGARAWVEVDLGAIVRNASRIAERAGVPLLPMIKADAYGLGAVRIARALATTPSFILLDEPFSGIDPIAVLDLQKIIFDLKASNIGVLVTDHNVRETLSVTDRAYIINDGRIFRAGTPEQLGNDPEVKRVYLGESFSLV